MCLLCDENKRLFPVSGADDREYRLCEKCGLIFVAPRFFPSEKDAYERYKLHNNSPDDDGYLAFLNRVVEPMSGFIRPGMRGLDYGCGPGPALCRLVEKAGLQCDNFDPLFFPDPPLPPYDFIFSTETFEHFINPREEIRKLNKMLRPDGCLGVMTERWDSIEKFKTWYYTRDITHVCFYHQRSFDYICRDFGFLKIFDDGKRVVILKKKGASPLFCDSKVKPPIL